jgi:hypothetical protein
MARSVAELASTPVPLDSTRCSPCSFPLDFPSPPVVTARTHTLATLTEQVEGTLRVIRQDVWMEVPPCTEYRIVDGVRFRPR